MQGVSHENLNTSGQNDLMWYVQSFRSVIDGAAGDLSETQAISTLFLVLCYLLNPGNIIDLVYFHTK